MRSIILRLTARVLLPLLLLFSLVFADLPAPAQVHGRLSLLGGVQALWMPDPLGVGNGAMTGRTVRGLVQVDLAGEQTKFGLSEKELMASLERLRGQPGLRLEGLMVLPPFLEDPAALRPFFRRLRELRDRALGEGLLAGGELSMGMSHDFETAIEEGATLVRVGTAIFGERVRA